MAMNPKTFNGRSDEQGISAIVPVDTVSKFESSNDIFVKKQEERKNEFKSYCSHISRDSAILNRPKSNQLVNYPGV